MGRGSDVVVIGAGNAGLVAALSARQAGAEVLVLEAAPRSERGGNSRFSMANVRVAHGGMDDLAALVAGDPPAGSSCEPYPAERYVSDVEGAAAGARIDHRLASLLAESSYETVAWMRDQGVRWELKVDAAGEVVPHAALRGLGGGPALTDSLFAAAESAGVEVWYEAPADELVMEDGAVRGVRVARTAGAVEVRGAVVLASGGFEASPERRVRYLGAGWRDVRVRGSRFNTGVMLDRAVEAGAARHGHMGAASVAVVDADAPAVGDLDGAVAADDYDRHSYAHGILVNRHGRRFVDEAEAVEVVARAIVETGDVAFQIFDRAGQDRLDPRYARARAVERAGLRELAEALSSDAGALEQTVSVYNAAAAFGAAQPLDRAPFAAYAVAAGITFTYGGLRVDGQANVLDVRGEPIPGLYAAGEIVGGLYHDRYPLGSGLVRGAVFGRIAGRHAAATGRALEATAR